MSGGLSASRLPPVIAIVVLLAAYAAAGAYVAVVGSLPGVDAGPQVSLSIPPRGGPERPTAALLKPPGTTAATPRDVAASDEPDDADALARIPLHAEGAVAAAAEARPPEAAAAPPPAPPPPLEMPPVPAVSGLPAPSWAALPAAPAAEPLSKAPLPELLQVTHHAGKLPVIARDGRQSWQVYARPAPDAAAGPRVAVLITGLGLSRAATEAAIGKLPAEVSLAFSPYARDLDDWLGRARAAGHEVLLELPMEPRKFPARDPGPLGLLTSLPPATVMARLERVMGAGAGYVGLVAPTGSPFAASESAAKVLSELKRRGLLYVADAAPEAQRPAFVPIGHSLDEQPFRDAIDVRLNQLADMATKGGQALAITDPLPVAIERLALWLPALSEIGITLTPVSALAVPPTP